MTEGVKLLQELKTGSYQAAVFGSYNVSFPFFEEVVLRALRSHGCDHNILLMDAAQCAASLADPELAPQLAGRHYALVPVAAPGAFHPKFMLLLGKRNSKLMIGSHNLTLSGFGLNREIANVATINDHGTEALGQAVFEFAFAWARSVADELANLVEACRNWAPWLGARRTPDARVRTRASALGVLPGGPCLWDQLRSHVDDSVTRVTVVGPYFDSGLQFIETIHQTYPNAELVVGVNPEHSQIDAARANRLSDVEFKDATGWLEDDPRRLVHAKALHLELRSGESVLVSGSANPSAPAWLESKWSNAELVLLRRLEKGDQVPEGLGLDALGHCPSMTEAAWQATAARQSAEPPERGDRGRAWVALETDQGFTASEGFAEASADVAVIGRESSLLATVGAVPGPEKRVAVPLAEDELRARAVLLEANHAGVTNRAVIQHLRELQDRATSQKRRSLRKALMDLDSADDGIDSYLAIIEKAIFDEEPVPRQRADRSRQDRAATSPASGAVGVGELVNKGRRKARLSTGDIGLVLDALIHKLGEGLPGDVSVAARMSEEQIDENTELPNTTPTRDEQHQLAHRCRLKTRKLMRRMTKRLELAWNDEAEPFAIIVQLVASLGLLHRLNERASKFAWLPRGEQLVETDHLWDLFKEAAVVAFAPENGAAEPLMEEHGDFSELASSAALILWSAWTTGLDVATAMSRQAVEDEEQDENLAGLSLLLNCLHQELLPDDEELEHLFGEDGRAWLDRHLSWAAQITATRPVQGPVNSGDVVRFLRSAGGVAAGVVINTAERKVQVMDRVTGELRKYPVDAVERVGVANIRGAR